MKLIIIGGRGMLGSKLCDVLGEHAPTCWDKEDIDIRNQDDVREKIRTAAPGVVINAAAFTNVDTCETQKEEAHAVNEIGVKNLADACRNIDATLIHYSTDYVFPGDKKDGYTEDDSPGPAVNAYGESKLAGERALRESGAQCYLIRTAWLYGPHGKNFVETMLHLAQNHRQLNVVNDQHGSPTYTKDVAEFTRTLMHEHYPVGIYHAVNSGSATWFDVANKIFQLSHAQVDVKPIPSEEYPLPAQRPKYSVLKNTKGPKMRPWEKALEDYILHR